MTPLVRLLVVVVAPWKAATWEDTRAMRGGSRREAERVPGGGNIMQGKYSSETGIAGAVLSP